MECRFSHLDLTESSEKKIIPVFVSLDNGFPSFLPMSFHFLVILGLRGLIKMFLYKNATNALLFWAKSDNSYHSDVWAFNLRVPISCTCYALELFKFN